MSTIEPNQDILENDTQAPAGENAAAWPGVREDAQAKVRFPGEDGGKSLSEIAHRDLDAALQLLAERAQYITGATGAAIALGTSESMVCRASAGSSAPEVGSELQVSSGLSGESVRSRQLLKCDDAQTDGRVNRESCEALGIASVVVMPMVDGGEVIGVFELFSDRAHAFAERDIDALERMGSMVRTALEQATHPSQSPVGDQEDDEVVIADEPDMAQPAKVAVIEMPVPELGADDDDAVVLEDLAETKEEPEPLFLAGATPVTRQPAEEADPGEIFRDAAERTAAAKAGLIEAAGLSDEESAPGRFAFHMRMPTKTGTVAENENKIDGVADATEAWSTPKIEEPENKSAAEASSAPKMAPAIAVTASGAATAPAPEKVSDSESRKAAIAETAAVRLAEVPVKPAEPQAAAPARETAASLEPAKGPAPQIARPASTEGRSRIAISQLRRCEACGFPVSEGRQYCLDCEKKPNKPTPKTEAKAVTQPAATAQAPIPPKPEAMATPALPTKPVPEATAVVETKQARPAESAPPAALQGAKPTGAPSERKGEAPEPEITKSAAKPETVEEPPIPHFMVTPPDQYESWIVSHMYSAVAIAVVIVGIIVYLLSR